MTDQGEHSEPLSDQEFLKEIRERLKRTGNFVLIVDSANVQFARIIGVVLGFGALILLTLFGFNIERMGDELASANERLTVANESLAKATDELNAKRDEFEKQFTDAMVEANQELKEIQQEEERVRRIADRNLEQAITTFADLILEANVNSEAEGSDDTRRLAGIMRNYLARNIDFARQEQHTAVEIAMLRRLALLEYDLRNERMFIEHFDTAIALAEREERFDMAADLQVEYADVRVKSFSHQGAPVTAKARLLLQSALLNYERELANRTRDDRIQLAMAVAHKRLAETFELEDANELALDHLDRARALHMELRPSDEQLTVIDRQARLYEALGEIGTAKRLINESISVAEDIEKYNFVSDKHLKLARLSNEPNETTTQLCLAWEALERLDPDQSKRLRFESRAVRVQEDFNVAEC